MEVKRSSLVLVHLVNWYPLATKVKDPILKYIKTYEPRVYQLLQEGIGSGIIIDYGDFYQSENGEVSPELKERLKQDKKNGYDIVLAGGYWDRCLKNAFMGMKDLDPKMILRGIFGQFSKPSLEELARSYGEERIITRF